MEIAFVISLLVIAIVLFATERISVDVITFMLLIALVTVPFGSEFKGILTPAEAFEGFSNEIIIILGSIFVISSALQETGVLDALGARLSRMAPNAGGKLTAVIMTATSSISAFMNNTTVTAMMLGPVLSVARRAKVNPSKLLLPMAYASILGGTCTLIGTSTNVAVSGYLKKAGLPEIGMFEIMPVGIVICLVGIVYMVFVGRHILPDRSAEDKNENFAIRHYLSEIVILPGSPLIKQYCFESDLSVLDFRVVKLIRGKIDLQPNARTIFAEGDVVLVEGIVANLMKVKKIEGIEIRAQMKLDAQDLESAQFRTAEILLTSQSDLVGRTLKEADLRQRRNLTALAIYRHGQQVLEQIGDLVLRVGDILLVQGPGSRIRNLQTTEGLVMLDEVRGTSYNPRKGLVAIVLFILSIVASSLGILPVSIAFLLAAVIMILAGCVNIEKAYEFIDWRLLVLIGGMTAFGTAMNKTGTADFLANLIVQTFSAWGPMAVLAGFFLLTILLTQPMSNAAAALVVLPVALHAAEQLNVNPRTFGIGVMLAASISLIAPFEPACILVYGPGRYRFADFVKTGAGLTLLLAVIVIFLIPVFWSL